jgi:mono/diheme cytochrome c family protein
MLKHCLVLIVLLVSMASCAGSQSSVPSSKQPSTPSSPAKSLPPVTPSAGQSVDQLAQTGNTVYASSCVRCHGDKGQGVTGPAVIGANANLAKYTTAKGLYDYLSTAMPAFAPGSLPAQSYLQLLAYLLVENKFVLPGTTLDPTQLDSIKLAK